ncbi:uncharacterized protein LOC134455356 [Engraulis encrasicolus]|uniref:uncharacterized protein LOC134455356 n=1 Tax=Engraulis encrasicolus TaxID=184585 RepID=UPI002FD34F77
MELQVSTISEVSQRNVFNAWQYRHLFTFHDMRGKNVIVMCNLCLPKVNLLSSSRYSTSNLKKHLERRHVGFEEFKAQRVRVGQPPRPKTDPGPSNHHSILQGPSNHHSNHHSMIHWEPPLKQVKIEDVVQPLQQEVMFDESEAVVDSLVFNFLLEDMQPLALLERPAFRKLVEGLSGGMMMTSRETVEGRLEEEKVNMVEELRVKLSEVMSVCTTVDVWMAHRRSYLSMMCHWVDPNDLQRKSAALACSRIQDELTYDTVASKIHEVHVTYGIENKVQAVVTNSGSKFVPAFHEFQGVEGEEEGELCDFVDINALLSAPPAVGEDGPVEYFLPPHQQSVSHVLSLVAREDLLKALMQHPMWSLYCSAMAKCSTLWRKTHRDTREATEEDRTRKNTLLLPQVSRWSFEYGVVRRLMSLSDLEFAHHCEQNHVPNLLPDELSLLKEYVGVLKPLAISFSLLQGEDRGFLGLALPTLMTLKKKLRENKDAAHFLSDVIDALLAGIDRRFAAIFSSHAAKMAAMAMPQFRLWWLSGAEREEAQAALMVEAAHLHPDAAEDAADSGSSSCHNNLEDDFFNFGPAGGPSSKAGHKGEILRYLDGTAKMLPCLKDFPTVLQLFHRYNTVLTSCCPVDNLFCHDGDVCIPQQSALGDQHLEQMLLLRYNGLPSRL